MIFYRYRILNKIDKGAHGQILAAKDLENESPVAIKFMLRDQRHQGKFDKGNFNSYY